MCSRIDYVLCKKSVEDPIHFIIHCERYKDYRDSFVKKLTNLNMKIKKKNSNKIIQFCKNFKVNAATLSKFYQIYLCITK